MALVIKKLHYHIFGRNGMKWATLKNFQPF